MNQNQTISVDIESRILQGIQRRLEVSEGTCTISVKSLTRRAARESGLIEDEAPPRWAFEMADRLLREKGGTFWGYGSGGKKNGKRRNPLQAKVYIFNKKGCLICGNSESVKTPYSTFCVTCGGASS